MLCIAALSGLWCIFSIHYPRFVPLPFTLIKIQSVKDDKISTRIC